MIKGAFILTVGFGAGYAFALTHVDEFRMGLNKIMEMWEATDSPPEDNVGTTKYDSPFKAATQGETVSE